MTSAGEIVIRLKFNRFKLGESAGCRMSVIAGDSEVGWFAPPIGGESDPLALRILPERDQHLWHFRRKLVIIGPNG